MQGITDEGSSRYGHDLDKLSRVCGLEALEVGLGPHAWIHYQKYFNRSSRVPPYSDVHDQLHPIRLAYLISLDCHQLHIAIVANALRSRPAQRRDPRYCKYREALSAEAVLYSRFRGVGKEGKKETNIRQVLNHFNLTPLEFP